MYRAQIEKIKSDAYASAERIASQTAQFLDTYIDGMNSIAEQVKYQDEVTNFFYNVKNAPIEKNVFEADILRNIEISSRLKNLLVGRTSDYSIFIFNSHGDFVSSQNYMIDRENSENLLKNDVYGRELMRIRAAAHKKTYSRHISAY